MLDHFMQIIIGIIFIIVGILNMKGNIKLLHSYHTKRVKKEDVLPFGRKIGLGIIIIGITIIVSGILDLLNYDSFVNIVLIIGFIPGFLFIFYALFKYNKGIF